MKKVLIAQSLLALLEGERSFLDRADVRVVEVRTSDEAVAVHRSDRADLIVLRFAMPGRPSDAVCALLREASGPGAAPLIMVCENSPEAIKACSLCRPDVMLRDPLDPFLLMATARQHLQIPVRDSLRVTLSTAVDARQTGQPPFACRTQDISASGMLIETDRRLSEGTLLSCDFYLPVAQRVEVTGRVVRIIERTPRAPACQYGLLFTDLRPETRSMLADYVDQNSRESASRRP